jgi:signal transduction histidine kinase
MLQRLASRVAHELRNPLNGAMLNVEVVRQRLQRSGVEPATLVPFGEAAASELARATALVDALLALARPASSPVDLVTVLDPLVVLYDAVATPRGGRVTLERSRGEMSETSANGDLVRCIVAAVLDQAIDDPVVRCEIAASDRAAVVDLRCSEREVALEAPILEAMTRAGIEQSGVPHGIVILFPRRGRERTREAS